MKLKTFNPAIVTRNAEAVIAFNERVYDFKVIHKTENYLGTTDVEYVLENPDGFRLDVIYVKDQAVDCHAMRVNVDDFEAALEEYKKEGFRIFADCVYCGRAGWDEIVRRGHF